MANLEGKRILKAMNKQLEPVEVLEDRLYDEPKKLYEVDEVAVKAYSKKLGIDLELAREKLALNYINEVEQVSAKEIALKNAKMLRIIGPKTSGLEMREQEVHSKLSNLTSTLNSLKNKVDSLTDIDQQFQQVKREMSKATNSMVKYHNNMVSQNHALQRRLAKLEASNLSLLEKLKKRFSKLLCYLKIR